MAPQNEDVLLKLPHGMKMRDVRWLSIWCRRFTVNYGDVYLPNGIQIPRPEASLLNILSMGHAIRNNIKILKNGSVSVCPCMYFCLCVQSRTVAKFPRRPL